MLRADGIRECLEGVIPGVVSTCSADGTPNVAYMSQGLYLDPDHIALSYQFFNKTRQNILANPRAALGLIHPQTGRQFRVHLVYERTETSGPVFEAMKAKLAGIASHTGMAGVFILQGSDIYRAMEIEELPGHALPTPPRSGGGLSALKACSQRLAACSDPDALLDGLLDGLQTHFGITHTLVMMLDPSRARLYTLASRGYEASGVGSEIAVGDGIIGVSVREGVPIRISHMTTEYAYGKAIRDQAVKGGYTESPELTIPYPGLPAPGSQMAVPIPAPRHPMGVIFVESPCEMRFTFEDEDSLVALAAQFGAMFRLLQSEAELTDEAPAPPPAAAPSGGAPVRVRHFGENDSVFLDEDYLIKGVAGNILWTLLQAYQSQGRTAFSNRELRLDPNVKLPDVSDNLEARLVLLHRRLSERQACVQLEKTGRGRFRLKVDRPLVLEEART
ncbi:MAG TPA: pyridoxamine 5'-phosphate oxidase family protein [Holophagaceae bacterium]|nr:pyridoxamine 5'-phosphate oxidase family protein [Holophagaceae bacterium]